MRPISVQPSKLIIRSPIIFLLILIPISLFSQSRFLERGQNGIGLSVGAGLNNEGIILQSYAGFSVKGNFDYVLGLNDKVLTIDDRSITERMISIRYSEQSEPPKID